MRSLVTPPHIAELAGQRVAIWGFGREGKAAIAALRQRLPEQALTLFCTTAEAEAARAFDAALDVRDDEPDTAALAAFDVVIKSPGISAYKPALLAAAKQGTCFTSGTALWFGENECTKSGFEKGQSSQVIAVTGTKGKSTTSALIAHLARALGVRTALAGNIGMPLLELLDQSAELWVIELSSFQTAEAGPLALGVITSLYEEHLDWHGSRERYVTDKLKLTGMSQKLLINATQDVLLEQTSSHPNVIVFGDTHGWHVANGYIRRGRKSVLAVDALSVPGLHNALNACAALAALEAVGLDAMKAAPALANFQPLPHRLQSLGDRHGLHWVNDSISTTPQATLAALESLQGRQITVLVGGHDRGLDWSSFVEAVAEDPPWAIICSGANGPRIATALREVEAVTEIAQVDGLDAAVERARQLTPQGGCVLLSPGAPSFDQFRDYAERGRRFAELAGFEGVAIAGIAGLGIA